MYRSLSEQVSQCTCLTVYMSHSVQVRENAPPKSELRCSSAVNRQEKLRGLSPTLHASQCTGAGNYAERRCWTHKQQVPIKERHPPPLQTPDYPGYPGMSSFPRDKARLTQVCRGLTRFLLVYGSGHHWSSRSMLDGRRSELTVCSKRIDRNLRKINSN